MNTWNKETLNELLKQFKNQKEMAEAVGVSAWVLGQYLSGEKKPGAHVCSSITLYCIQAGLINPESQQTPKGVYRLRPEMAANIEKVANHLQKTPANVVSDAMQNYLSFIIPAIDAGEEVL